MIDFYFWPTPNGKKVARAADKPENGDLNYARRRFDDEVNRRWARKDFAESAGAFAPG